MVDIQTVSIAIASASVVAGIVYYAFQVRHQTKIRQTDLVIRLHLTWTTKEYREEWTRFLNLEFEDYNDFVKKHGSVTSGKPASIAILTVAGFFEAVGVLVHRKLMGIGLVSDLFPLEMAWEKMKPIAVGWRKELDEPQTMEWFEYLYNEMQKREQKFQPKA